ncbi:hypothetical protein ACOMHN_001160 [Nucella lapillus]
MLRHTPQFPDLSPPFDGVCDNLRQSGGENRLKPELGPTANITDASGSGVQMKIRSEDFQQLRLPERSGSRILNSVIVYAPEITCWAGPSQRDTGPPSFISAVMIRGRFGSSQGENAQRKL